MAVAGSEGGEDPSRDVEKFFIPITASDAYNPKPVMN